MLLEEMGLIQDAGIAVLCLKPPRFRQEGLAEEVVQRARELDFPLVELPITAIFSNIVQESMEEILRRETQAFQFMQDKLEHLLDAFMCSDDPEDTLTAVEEAISNPVMIFDEQNELLVSPRSRELLQGPVQDDLIKQLYKRTDQQLSLIHI